MNAREEIREALKCMPIGCLHMPLLAHARRVPVPKDGQAKPLPIVAYAAIGVAAGGGLQLASQYLKAAPATTDADAAPTTCDLTLKELEDKAVQIYEDSLNGKDGGILKQIADGIAEPGAKPFPLALAAVANPPTVAFLSGVAAGAWAAGR